MERCANCYLYIAGEKMSFSADLSRIIKKTNGNIDLVVRKITADVFRSVILKTPVMTGRARGNWQASADAPKSGYSMGRKDKSGGKVIAEAVQASKGAGGITYLVNNLPYIRPLEYGSSKQAPSGMVRLTVLEFKNHLQTALRAIK